MANYSTGLLSQPMFADILGYNETIIDNIIRFITFRHNEWSLDKTKYKQYATLTRYGIEEDVVGDEANTYLIFWQIHQPNLVTSIKEYDFDKMLSQKMTTLLKSEVRIFKNKTTKTTILICDGYVNLDHVDVISMIAASIPLLLPWFKIEEPDKAIFRAIYEHNLTVIKEWADGVPQSVIDEAQKMYITKKLDNVKNASKERMIKKLKIRYEDLMYEIQNCREIILNKQSELTDVINQQMALELLEDSTDDISEFFIQHKSIVEILNVYTSPKTIIDYSVTTPFQFYDEDALKRTMNSAKSWFHTSCEDWQRQLIVDVFIRNKVTMMATATFSLVEFADIVPKTFSYNSKIPSIPNPHIYYYGCLGGNQQFFNQFAKTGEWELAIEQSIGCTANINFCDVSVMNKFVSCLKEVRRAQTKILRYKGQEMDIDTYLAISDFDDLSDD